MSICAFICDTVVRYIFPCIRIRCSNTSAVANRLVFYGVLSKAGKGLLPFLSCMIVPVSLTTSAFLFQMFPKDWCVLHMTINKVILNTLTELAIPLRDRFLEGKHFSQQVQIATEANWC